MSAQSFDYIVVGSGSSGAALAARLTENGQHSVLLLESGEDDSWIWLRIPAGVAYVVRGQRSIWRFGTEPDEKINNRSIFWPRGKVLGGSSGINGMIWVHGDPQEYDKWRDDLGLQGWGYDDLKTYFHKVESYADGAHGTRGTDGPVKITRYGPVHPMMDAYLSACEQAGIPRNPDYNSGQYEGVGILQFNVHNGLRCSTREAYLRPAAKRQNLQIRTGAHATRVLFTDKVASGIEYLQNGQLQTATAKREVILCAGAVQSPQLLELSGIGNPDLLKAQGVDVVHALPAVGENLRDHLYSALSYECRGIETLNQLYPSLYGKFRMAARLMLARNGLMSCCGQIAHALVRTNPDDPQPDAKIQLHWLSSPASRDPKRYVLDDYPGVTIGSFPLRPKSTGSVHIQSPFAMSAPKIQANYLDHKDDRRTTSAALQMARKILSQPALAPWVVQQTRPGKDQTSDEQLLQWARQNGTTSYHPIGTCRMGSDAASVVDAELRVRGVQGLRVADCSIFPTMCSSNTNAPAMAVGEKAADLILSGH